jgi:4'-phosphopantetheinyl transferase EntD
MLRSFSPLRALLPAEVAVVEAEDTGDDDLFPEEAAFVARAVEKRRREFASGRWCARRALFELGWREPVVLLPGSGREPCWPHGVVGSITHCEGYCAAAVAWRADIVSLGIDAERNRALPPDVEDLVCSVDELRRLPKDQGTHWSTLVFSAKEGVYKAWYPLTRQPLEFCDVDVILHPETSAFVARIAAGGPGLQFDGTFAATDSHVFTAVCVRA